MNVQELMNSEGTKLSGPLLLKPKIFEDERGFFFESWNQLLWDKLLSDHGQSSSPFVQDNHSRSVKGVLRGLHYQLPPHPQGKLVRCVSGKVFDVAVDLRVNSPTQGQWVAASLSAENHQTLWIPVGFAHGFLTLSSNAEVLYKTTDFWSSECERAIRWDDPQLAINWPDCGISPQLSEKDKHASLIADFLKIGLFE